MKTITLQPSEYTDQITEDGHELTKLPYPFHVNKDGYIQRQDFWRGSPYRVVGFVDSPESTDMRTFWSTVWKDPSLAVGKYVVTADQYDAWGTHQNAIKTAEVTGL